MLGASDHAPYLIPNGQTDTEGVKKKVVRLLKFVEKKRCEGCSRQLVHEFCFHYATLEKTYCSESCWVKNERSGE